MGHVSGTHPHLRNLGLIDLGCRRAIFLPRLQRGLAFLHLVPLAILFLVQIIVRLFVVIFQLGLTFLGCQLVRFPNMCCSVVMILVLLFLSHLGFIIDVCFVIGGFIVIEDGDLHHERSASSAATTTPCNLVYDWGY